LIGTSGTYTVRSGPEFSLTITVAVALLLPDSGSSAACDTVAVRLPGVPSPSRMSANGRSAFSPGLRSSTPQAILSPSCSQASGAGAGRSTTLVSSSLRSKVMTIPVAVSAPLLVTVAKATLPDVVAANVVPLRVSWRSVGPAASAGAAKAPAATRPAAAAPA
jgi:hypothetical protein